MITLEPKQRNDLHNDFLLCLLIFLPTEMLQPEMLQLACPVLWCGPRATDSRERVLEEVGGATALWLQHGRTLSAAVKYHGRVCWVLHCCFSSLPMRAFICTLSQPMRPCSEGIPTPSLPTAVLYTSSVSSLWHYNLWHTWPNWMKQHLCYIQPL